MHPLCPPPAPSRTCWSKHFPLPGPQARSSPDMLWFSNSPQFSLDPRVSEALHPPRMWVLESGEWGRVPLEARPARLAEHAVSRDPARGSDSTHPRWNHHLLFCLSSVSWPQAALVGPLGAPALGLLCSGPCLELGAGAQTQLLRADAGRALLISILAPAGVLLGPGEEEEDHERSFSCLPQGPSCCQTSVSHLKDEGSRTG